MADLGHNVGQGDAAFHAEIEALKERLSRLPAKLDEDAARLASDIIRDERKLRTEMTAAKDVEKRPHLDANAAIEARFKPLIEAGQKVAAIVGRMLVAFEDAEKARRKAEAAEAARRVQEAAEAARQAQGDPFDEFEALEAAAKAQAQAEAAAQAAGERVSVASAEGKGRAVGFKTTWRVEVADAAKLVKHYAKRQAVIDAALKLAETEAKASKGEAVIPGVVIHADRRVA